MRSLDKHVTLKKKYIRGNYVPFMNKELSKAKMHRSKLLNNFLQQFSIRNNGITVSLC